MARSIKLSRIFAALFFTLFWAMFGVSTAESGTCEEGRGQPPFLGETIVTPNIMLMIDNSASMYDLGYAQEVGRCEDESYIGTQTAGVYDESYSGYFNQSSWYYYNEYTDADTADDQFIETDAATAAAFCNDATGTKYFSPDSTTPDICVTTDQTTTPNTINAFAASGHFLNWAASSKMDLQKLILTGGKFDDDTDQLIMESRGCVGRKMVKQVELKDAGGSTFKLSLGLTADDPKGGNTLIEIYEITDEDGYDSEACEAALDYLTLSGDSVKLGTLKGYIDDCIQNPSNDPIQADSNAAFNQSLHSCWYLTTQGIDAWEQTVQGDVTRIQNSCQKIYEAGVSPQTQIEPNDSGYVCAGNYGYKTGFVGRCWGAAPSPASGSLDTGGGQTLMADALPTEQLYGEESKTKVKAQEKQAGRYEQLKFKLISALRSFMAEEGSRAEGRSGVMEAFFNFIVAEAEAAVGDPLPAVPNPTSEGVDFRESDATGEYAASSLHSNQAGYSAQWNQAIFEDGTYEVAVWYACEPSNPDPAASYTVTDSYGNTPSYEIDQGSGCGDWVVLGNHHFTTVSGAVVKVDTHSESGVYWTNADAVRFKVVALDAGACGDGIVNLGEECDDGVGNSNNGACLDTCKSWSCGDGYIRSGVEECDDGNSNNTDECLNTCVPATCGDGYVRAGIEDCDDGNSIPSDGCENDCKITPPKCGNGIIDTGEECDDGNSNNTDACVNCVVAFCGDTYVKAGVEQCDDGNSVSGDGCENDCTITPAICGNGIIDTGEECDDGNSNNTDECLNTCVKATCGDTFVQGLEECDDGNSVDGDGCENDCTITPAICGNGIIDTGEECDDGNLINTDACVNCVVAFCGDKFVKTGVEECDDGNSVSGDGCENDCTITLSQCGNGSRNGTEECDDDNDDNTDDCLNTCIIATCGDGFVHTVKDETNPLAPPLEECDDGNNINGDGCENDCTITQPKCGNGLIEAGETCDDGNLSNTDTCLDTCVPATCGDGYIRTATEQCDDGNSVSGDGCENDCTITSPSCGNGLIEAGETCDDGNFSNTDACLNTCVKATCGDGFFDRVTGVEQCDDGNTTPGDGCENDCTITPPKCGNGIIEAGEECDDGNLSNTDACLDTCRKATCGDGYTRSATEQCDDGNTDQTDDCLADCTFPPAGSYCGDGILDFNLSEECDDGNSIGYDGCQPDCTYLLPDPTTGQWIPNGYDYYGDGTATVKECQIQALLDFCNYINTPEVIDPSDNSSLGNSGDLWNIPAILTDIALKQQKGEPILTMKGRIQWTGADAPSGIIQEYADQVRLGIMKFQDIGDYSECNVNDDVSLFTKCSELGTTRDGALVKVPIDNYGDKIDEIIDPINDIKGTTWTPLAEAMYTADGYFGERKYDATGTNYRINDSGSNRDYDVTPYAPVWENQMDYAPDSIVMFNNLYYHTTTGGTSDGTGPLGDTGVTWTVKNDVHTDAVGDWNGATSYVSGNIVIDDNKFFKALSNNSGIPTSNTGTWKEVSGPVYAPCQSNNLVIITEGSSTADLNEKMLNFVTTNNDADAEGSGDLAGQCDSLKGSTYFDDLTYYGLHATDLYAIEPFGDYGGGSGLKSTIQTYIVYTGSAREGLSGECRPEQFLQEAATNGDPEGADDALLYGEEADKLETALDQLFRSILTKTSSGSAAAVISSSRSGAGALYQAIFWPDKDSGADDPDTGLPVYVNWTGEVHAFLVDQFGTLYLDTNGDGILQEPADTNGDDKKDILDKPVVIYFDENLEATKGCIGHIESTDPTTTEDDEVVFFNDDGSCPAIENLENFDYLWNTSEWLNSAAVDSNILANRTVTGGVFNFNSSAEKNRRYIFTWNDLDNDGVVNQVTEVLPFIENFGVSGFPNEDGTKRAPVVADFGVDITDNVWATHQTNRIIKWIRGQDQGEETIGSLTYPEMRSREIQGDLGSYTWRLGDVIHSTPVTVGPPAENYQQLYRDLTYADFVDKYQYRRQMVYFGANDGMLHAVNGGFYRMQTDTATFDENQRFCLTDACVITNGVEQSTDFAPELGAEMWAYVPYNLMPHLKCLTDPGYTGGQHKYFVDLRPRIFDVQIFDEEPACTSDSILLYKHPDCIHPNGWGTILVGGMGFGGSPTSIDYLVDMNNDGTGETPDNRIFTSAYFILDITNPEMPPVLLGEYTKTNSGDEVDLGYTTVISTMIPMKVDEDINADNNLDSTGPGQGEDTNCNSTLDNFSKWYLVLGSGPTELDGTSNQYGSLSIVPLDRLVDTDGLGSDTVQDMRIPNAVPTSTDEFGRFVLADNYSFISDLITVDFDINKNYLADVVYFGSIDGNWGSWSGKLNRLVVRDWVACNSRQTQIETKPSEWAGLSPSGSPIRPLIEVDQPITASPSVATDGTDFWVYFGTGRFFDVLDKSDLSSNATQTFYGIREPVDDTCTLSWDKVWNNRLDPGWTANCRNLDPSMCCTGSFDSRCLMSGSFGDNRGTLGLIRTDQIEIFSTVSETQPKTLGCVDGTTNCLPDALIYTTAEAANVTTATDPVVAGDTKSFNDLLEHITGDYFNCYGTSLGKDGWYMDFHEARERNLGQAAILGGIVSFTTYKPYNDPCKEEGLGYLYSVYYLTGTPWIEDIFGFISPNSDPRAENLVRVDLGKGLSTTPNIHIGSKEGTKAFIQTSVGKIVEIPQPNLPSKDYKTGRVKWRDLE